MSRTEINFQQGLLPYSDNSGFRYKIGVEMSAEGSASVSLESCGSTVLIEVDHWSTVRDAIDEALAFARSRIAGEA